VDTGSFKIIKTMRYIFSEFEFNSASLVLTKNGEAVAIRHNEAKVLALLLENTDKVLSKEDILSEVWQDKVVSEQAVFQNISHLRSLFGNHAIKTFPKRGYQWQLENEYIEQAELTAEAPVSSTQAPVPTSPVQKKNANWVYALIAGLMFIIYAVMDRQTESIDSEPTHKIAYVPITDPQGLNSISLNDNGNFDFTALTHLTTRQFMASLETEYQSLAKEHTFILSGQLRTHQELSYLDFLLKGPFGDWQGQISGNSVQDVVKQLEQHLKQDFIYQLLGEAQPPELRLASLSIAHQQTPNDFITLGNLINTYIEMGELEKAMVMADKLENTALTEQNPLQVGNALLYQSTVLTRKELFELSTQKLNLAIEEFKKIRDLKRQADAWNAQSWLDHQNKDYPAIKTSLLKSAQLALEAKDIERELHALTYLSVMAHKHHQEEDKYLYLTQAEDKMREYQLPIYRFIKIPFHHAIHAKTRAAKEPHLKQVLEFAAMTPDHWVAQSSRKQLMEHYIAQHRLDDARALLANATSDNAQNSYLKTLLAKAEQDNEAFVLHAQRTFEQANLAGEKKLSLDIALLLCEASDLPVNYDFYSQYIQDNANKRWRQANETKLMAINL